MKTLQFVIYIFLFSSISHSQLLSLYNLNCLDSLGVTIKADTVIITDSKLCSFCSSKFAISVSQSSDTLLIIQTDTSSIYTTCTCLFDLDVSITGLSSGNYSAVVYRKYLQTYGYPIDTTIFIGSLQFNLPTSTSNITSSISNQSECIISDVNEVEPYIPVAYSLYQNYPNPFNPATNIDYEIYKDGNVYLKVFDCLGNEIKVLINEYKEEGKYSIEFDATDFPSGLYFYQLRINEFLSTKKMVLLK